MKTTLVTLHVNPHNCSNLSLFSVLPIQSELDKRLSTSKFDAKTSLNTKLNGLVKLPKEGTILLMGFGRFKATENTKSDDLLNIVSFTENEPETLLDVLGR